MVFFVCEGCNETLKKNQVEKHTYSCRQCHAVTCVDCSVTFYGNDYTAHTTCISEAEKYEKSLYKPKQSKPKPQDIWVALIEEIVSLTNEAPQSIRPYLSRLSSLTNVPRNKKKFINFAKNSLNLRSDAVLEDLWNFLDSSRQKRESAFQEATAPAAEEVKAIPEKEMVATEENSKEESKKSKKKKRYREENTEPQENIVQEKKKVKIDESDATEVQKDKKEKKEKKDKKEKKEKKHKKEKESL